MAKKKDIPDEIQRSAEEVVARFNSEHLDDVDVRYIVCFKESYLYLDRSDFGRSDRICRLKYSGDFADWEFAIFKFSSETYDPDEWMFPGSDAVDGSIEGAMLAGLEAYPP